MQRHELQRRTEHARTAPSRQQNRTKPPTPKPKPKRRLPPEILTHDEVQALLAACSKRWTGSRNRAMLAILYRSGLRITEALSLHAKDLDATAGTLRVLHGKGNRSRTVGMDPGGFAMVAAWIERRASLGIDPNNRGPLLCLRDGSRMESSHIRTLLPRLARIAGIRK